MNTSAITTSTTIDKKIQGPTSPVSHNWLQRCGLTRSSTLKKPAESVIPEVIVPRVNVMDHDTEIVVRAEIPGVNLEDLDITVSEFAVTIRGCTRHNDNCVKENFNRYDLTCGSFVRTVGLLRSVDPQKAQAIFDQGVLQVIVPVTYKAKQRHITFTAR